LPLRGQFADTSTNWYILIAPAIMKTMILLSVFPQINILISYVPKAIKRFIDSGTHCCDRKHNTKKTTVNSYVDLYSGPEMLMYFKYSNVMNITLVTLTHGVAMPMLFPIGLFAICNNYVTEKLLLAYYYRQPPMLDNRMNNRALTLLKYSPVLMLMYGFWYLGNRQIFFNEFTSVTENFGEVKDAKHRVFDFSKGPDHTVMILICVPFILGQKYVIKGVMKFL